MHTLKMHLFERRVVYLYIYKTTAKVNNIINMRAERKEYHTKSTVSAESSDKKGKEEETIVVDVVVVVVAAAASSPCACIKYILNNIEMYMLKSNARISFYK